MTVTTVETDLIEIVPTRDHRGVNADLQDLLESIPTIGMLHPLLVQPERNGKYELLAGHRRLRAARQLGCTEVRVQVIMPAAQGAHARARRSALPRSGGSPHPGAA